MKASALTVAAVAIVAVVLPGCRNDGLVFYEVTRAPTEECDILPQGEFCVEPEELSPPTFEIWSVEYRGSEVRVFIDDEVWVTEPPAEGEDPNLLLAEKLEVAAREPGPCTTETTRSFQILPTAIDLTGTISERNRLDGPEDCGETPRGLRTTARLDGVRVEAP